MTGAKKSGKKGPGPKATGSCCGKPLKNGKCACCKSMPCKCQHRLKS